jgi:hypothetical protein
MKRRMVTFARSDVANGVDWCDDERDDSTH